MSVLPNGMKVKVVSESNKNCGETVNKAIIGKFESYPPKVRERLIEVRQIIFEVVDESNLGNIAEELKWGEPSYSCKCGSPIRNDWKLKPNIIVNCKTFADI